MLKKKKDNGRTIGMYIDAMCDMTPLIKKDWFIDITEDSAKLLLTDDTVIVLKLDKDVWESSVDYDFYISNVNMTFATSDPVHERDIAVTRDLFNVVSKVNTKLS